MICGRSAGLRQALDLCRRYATAHRPVVFAGPVGSGKTMLARELHAMSGRRGDFVSLSAGELSDTLFPDTLFGHVHGAFTGASARRAGVFQRAAGGTVLLDDLAFMSIPAQAAILRVLEDRRVTPLGATREIPITCREVFGTTRAPADLVASGILLPDLESRLGELIVTVPSLKQRTEDIAELAAWFAQAFADEHDFGRRFDVSDKALELLGDYDWPRNVRELKGVVERAVLHAHADGERHITPKHLPERIRRTKTHGCCRHELSPERVNAALEAANGNQTEAARRLGVHRNTVRRYLHGHRETA